MKHKFLRAIKQVKYLGIIVLLMVIVLLAIGASNLAKRSFAEGRDAYFLDDLQPASESNIIAEDKTGAVNWTLYANGYLSVTAGDTNAEGIMPDYTDQDGAPWLKYVDSIQFVTVGINDNDLRNISAYAFSNCVNLKAVRYSESVTTIGENAFMGCTSLPAFVFGQFISSVGDNAFSGCSALDQLVFCACYPTISDTAFTGVTANGYRHSDDGQFGGNISWLEDTDTVLLAQGRCGDDADWSLYASGLLEINGFGAMRDYELLFSSEDDNQSTAPWSFIYGSFIQSVRISDGIDNVGAMAFAFCENLQCSDLAESVNTIGKGAFQQTSIDYVSVSASLIGPEAYKNCDNLSNLSIFPVYTYVEGDSVALPVQISESAFENCTNLAGVSFLANEVYIEKNAFSYCKKLSDVLFSCYCDGNVSIAEDAFTDVTAMVRFSPYSGIDSVAYQDYGGTLTWFSGAEGDLENGVLWSLSFQGQLSFTGSGEICYPDTAPWSGYSTLITEINMSEEIIGMQEGVFSGLTDLETVYFSANIIDIPANAFSECNTLSSVNNLNNIEVVGDFAFYHTNVCELDFSSSLSTIGEKAFAVSEENPYNFRVRFRGKAPSISGDAFKNRSELFITYPGTKESWSEYVNGEETFGAMSVTWIAKTGLDIVDQGVFGDNITWTVDEEGTLRISGTGEMPKVMGSAEIPWGFSSYTNVIVEEGITSICSYACSASNSSGIQSLKLPDTLKRIDEYAIEGCSFKELVIPESVTFIGEGNFSRCSELTSLVIPDSVTKFAGAVSGCTNLEDIRLPSGMMTIPKYMFRDCSKLTEVQLPDGLKTINEQAFYNCSSLTSITIPEAVEFIDHAAFASCEKLSEVKFKGDVYLIDDYAFLNSNPTFYYYTGSDWTEEKPASPTDSRDPIENVSLDGMELGWEPYGYKTYYRLKLQSADGPNMEFPMLTVDFGRAFITNEYITDLQSACISGINEGKYDLWLCAVAVDEENNVTGILSSVYKDTVDVSFDSIRAATPKNVKLENMILSWDYADGSSSAEIKAKVNGEENTSYFAYGMGSGKVSTYDFSGKLLPGTYQFSVIAQSFGEYTKESLPSEYTEEFVYLGTTLSDLRISSSNILSFSADEPLVEWSGFYYEYSFLNTDTLEESVLYLEKNTLDIDRDLELDSGTYLMSIRKVRKLDVWDDGLQQYITDIQKVSQNSLTETITYVPNTGMVLVGDQKYETIEDALLAIPAADVFGGDDLKEETEIILLEDCTAQFEIGDRTGNAAQNIHLNLNGHRLIARNVTGLEEDSVVAIRVNPYSRLSIISDSRETVLYLGSGNEKECKTGILNEGILELQDCSISVVDSVVYPIENYGKLYLNGNCKVENGVPDAKDESWALYLASDAGKEASVSYGEAYYVKMQSIIPSSSLPSEYGRGGIILGNMILETESEGAISVLLGDRNGVSVSNSFGKIFVTDSSKDNYKVQINGGMFAEDVSKYIPEDSDVECTKYPYPNDEYPYVVYSKVPNPEELVIEIPELTVSGRNLEQKLWDGLKVSYKGRDITHRLGVGIYEEDGESPVWSLVYRGNYYLKLLWNDAAGSEIELCSVPFSVAVPKINNADTDSPIENLEEANSIAVDIITELVDDLAVNAGKISDGSVVEPLKGYSSEVIADALENSGELNINFDASRVDEADVLAYERRLVKDTVVEAEESVLVGYVDTNIYIQGTINDQVTNIAKITDTSSEDAQNLIDFKVVLTEEEAAALEGKEISVVRVHNGEAEVLSGEEVSYESETRTVTFRSNKFSTFAVVGCDELPRGSLEGESLSLVLDNQINVVCYVRTKNLVGYDETYLKVLFKGKEYKISGTPYEAENINYVRYEFKDIAAKEISDEMKIYVVGIKDGVTYESTEKVYSVKQYCMNRLRLSDDEGLKTLCADLLNYGAAAQTFFNYHADDLANKDMTSEYQAFATQDEPLLNGCKGIYLKKSDATIELKALSLLLESAVAIKCYYRVPSEMAKEEIKFKIWKDKDGDEIEDDGEVSYCTTFEYEVKEESNECRLVVNSLVAKEMRTKVYVSACDINGLPLSDTVRYSIESYAYGKQNDTTPNLSELVTMMMKYGDATAAYFKNSRE